MSEPKLPSHVASKIRTDPDGCWRWTGHVNRGGYGRIAWKRKATNAHRIVWMLLRGPLPAGLVSDHLCRNRSCVNPDHIEFVSSRENTLRGEGITAQQARRTHCIHGHEFTPENTYRKANGGRNCKACNLANSKRRHAKGIAHA